MKNVQDIVDTGQCIGCAACYGVCPNGYITFKDDGGMGFPVPAVSHCDDCGLCLRACPSQDFHEDA